MTMRSLLLLVLLTVITLAGCTTDPVSTPAGAGGPRFDVILRNGTVYDGTGAPGVRTDVGILGDMIAVVGPLAHASAKREIDATDLAVAPGFINMLSWATESLIVDGRSESDIRQGVTLEIFGEGVSMGPLNEAMRQNAKSRQKDVVYDIPWTTLDEYLVHLTTRGVSPNVASFVGATTVRIHELGSEDRAPTPEELDRMKQLVRQAMEEGALGVGSSLIYAPATFSSTEELIALASMAGEYGGMYISHLRSEGDRLMESVDELIRIAREGRVKAEIYHLKQGGERNWDLLQEVIDRVEGAHAEGLEITADMYMYTAGATGLNAAMPPWVQEGGHRAWVENLKNPELRERLIEEIRNPGDGWENLYELAGAENVILAGFRNESLRPLTGKTLAEVATEREQSPEETILDLVVEDDSRVEAIYFLMSEENVARQTGLPWMSFCSDAASLAPRGSFLDTNPHPRAYGSFARLLGKYVREEKALTLADAVHRLSGFPARNLGLRRRGFLTPGHFADVVVFDPDEVRDHATFEEPHRFSTGVHHVLVNGTPVLLDGDHTGALPGRVVRGPGHGRRKPPETSPRQ